MWKVYAIWREAMDSSLNGSKYAVEFYGNFRKYPEFLAGTWLQQKRLGYRIRIRPAFQSSSTQQTEVKATKLIFATSLANWKRHKNERRCYETIQSQHLVW